MQFETTIRRVLERHSYIRLAILFGSFATGHIKPDSDLDVAVDAGRPVTVDEKMKLIEDLAIEIGRPVDLIYLAYRRGTAARPGRHPWPATPGRRHALRRIDPQASL